MALAEITFPPSTKNVTAEDYFIYTSRKAKEVLTALGRVAADGLVVQRPGFSSNGKFSDGEL